MLILGLILLKLKDASNRPVYFRDSCTAYGALPQKSSRITFQPTYANLLSSKITHDKFTKSGNLFSNEKFIETNNIFAIRGKKPFLDYFSFTSYSYKVGLIRTLIDRAYKINNTWLGLHEDITKLMEILKKNLFPAHLIEGVVNRYITGTPSNHCPQGSLPTSPIFYFKLPYIGHFFVVTQKKIRHFIKRYCNDLDIKPVFSSFKIGNLLGVKDPIPGGLRARVHGL